MVRTESNARLYLGQQYFVEIPIVTPRGSSTYGVVSPEPFGSRKERDRWSLAQLNWAGFREVRIWLKLWKRSHDLRAGEHIEIGVSPDFPAYRRGCVTDVADQDLYLDETELRSSRR